MQCKVNNLRRRLRKQGRKERRDRKEERNGRVQLCTGATAGTRGWAVSKRQVLYMKHERLTRNMSTALNEVIAVLFMGQGNFKLSEKWAILQTAMTLTYVKMLDTVTKCGYK